MKKILLISISLINLNTLANFTTLGTQEMQAKMQQNIAIIDVRRTDEYQEYGIIPGAHKLTFFDKNGKYNTTKWLQGLSKIVKDKYTPFILVCAHANRTQTIGNFLDQKLNYKNVFELKGGIINGWIDKGLATTKLPSKHKKVWYQLW